MPLIAYLDEAGDHSLAKIDQNFPVFVLMFLICDTSEYIGSIVPTVYKLKFDYWGHEGVILHSRDIRRVQGDFSFLVDKSKKQGFYKDINQVMLESQYTLIATAIRKENLADNSYCKNYIYEVALKSSLERLVCLLEDCSQNRIIVVAESRGKLEDKDLGHIFFHIISHGTENIEASRFEKIQFKLIFKSKSMNIAGIQLADLIAYPTGRLALSTTAQYEHLNIFKNKFYVKNNQLLGLKIFP